jgi:GNAT superfamily N-acetyltransferase
MTGGATIRRLGPGESAIRVCAEWRHQAFLSEEGFSAGDALAQLEEFVAHQGFEAAFVAEVGGAPAGTCLFVRKEIEPRHDVSPWLAGLYVAPEFRKRSIGSQLVRAVEAHAHKVECRQIYLYTPDAEGYYEALGWQVVDRFDWDGEPFVLMRRGLYVEPGGR